MTDEIVPENPLAGKTPDEIYEWYMASPSRGELYRQITTLTMVTSYLLNASTDIMGDDRKSAVANLRSALGKLRELTSRLPEIDDDVLALMKAETE